ncbi:MAG: flagellar type III secretion system pore protein FliP [Planctomycetales bacterium]
MNLFLLLTVLSLAPSILMMTTCFVRFIIVFSLLRQALGTQQMPPNQVLISLSLFLTFMVMSPVWREAYEQGIKPYTSIEPGQSGPSLQQTFDRTARPIRRFMAEQLAMANNDEMLWMFIDYQKPAPGTSEARNYKEPSTYDEVPLSALLPAYMLSELKTSFIIGFQLYLPFLVIDMVISAVLISMGMMMLPPVLISLPFKLLLFVLVDGWALSVGRLLASVHG